MAYRSISTVPTGTRTTQNFFRRFRPLAVVVMLGWLLGACASPPGPPAPSTPKVTAHLSLTDATYPIVGVVHAEAVATGFPGDGNFDVEWTYRDLSTGSIIYTANTIGNSDGILSSIVQPGLFDTEFTGSTIGVDVGVTAKVSRDGSTTSAAASVSLSWSAPSSPVSGSIEATSIYSVLANTFTACAPLGTVVNLGVSGATADASAGFLDLTAPVLADFVPFSPSGTLTLTTTEPCFSVVVARASFAGTLSGTMNYTIDW